MCTNTHPWRVQKIWREREIFVKWVRKQEQKKIKSLRFDEKPCFQYTFKDLAHAGLVNFIETYTSNKIVHILAIDRCDLKSNC